MSFQSKAKLYAVTVTRILCISTIGLLSCFLVGGQSEQVEAPPTQIDVPKIAAIAKASVVTIKISDARGDLIATGTGFFISAEGELVTNYHVVEKGSQFVAQTETGAFYSIGGILSEDREQDVAILKAAATKVPFLPLNIETPTVGESIVVVGSPRGLEGTVSTGIVSAIRDKGSEETIQLTAAISPGSSGSPIINAKGEVIGVAKEILTNSQNINFAASAKCINDLLQKQQGGGAKEPTFDPSNIPSAVRDEAEFKVAITLLDTDPVQALKLLNSTIKRHPGDGLVNLKLAYVYAKLGMYADSVESYNKVIKTTPDNYLLWVNLAVSYILNHQLEQGRASVERAIKLEPEYSYAWRIRGLYFLQRGSFSEAIDDVERCTKLAPEDSQGWDMLSNLYRKVGLAAKAAEAQQKVAFLIQKSRNVERPPSTQAGSKMIRSTETGSTYTVRGVSKDDGLIVRKGPGMSFGASNKLANEFGLIHVIGTPVMNGKTEWVHVQFDGGDGWVRSKFLEKDDAPK